MVSRHDLASSRHCRRATAVLERPRRAKLDVAPWPGKKRQHRRASPTASSAGSTGCRRACATMPCSPAGTGRSAPGCCSCPAGGAWHSAPRWPDRRCSWACSRIGAVAMRGAGCTINDLADRDFDRDGGAHPQPTAGRGPARRPAGAGLHRGADAGRPRSSCCCLNRPAVADLARSRAADRRLPLHEADHLVAAGLPGRHLQLGRPGRLRRGRPAASTSRPSCSTPPGIAWTLGYDTIYAHQDKEDDAADRRAARRRCASAPPRRTWLWGFYGAALVALGAGRHGRRQDLLLLSRPGRGRRSCSPGRSRTIDLDDPADCLARFRANRDGGPPRLRRAHRRQQRPL